jgi:hypothetical protein
VESDAIDAVRASPHPTGYGLDHAMAAYTPDSMICIAGSLYLVGRARQILCGELVRGE